MAEAARRPLASRDRAWARGTAAWLARRRVAPNRISAASAAFAAAAGACWLATVPAQRPWIDTILYLAAALCIQGRLLCNLFDGLVAVEGGLRSPTGDLWNDVPDRLAGVANFNARTVSWWWMARTVVAAGVCGRHPVAPTVSPKTTWEGIVGGGLCAVCVGAGLWWMTPLTPLQSAGFSAVIVFCGFLGGLVMSAIKRDAGVKDWGHLIPGHGGILDRIDSLAFAAPAFFHLLRYVAG